MNLALLNLDYDLQLRLGEDVKKIRQDKREYLEDKEDEQYGYLNYVLEDIRDIGYAYNLHDNRGPNQDVQDYVWLDQYFHHWGVNYRLTNVVRKKRGGYGYD
jgi:hypothetical protein